MARALIVGCGCRGRNLGRELLDAGWWVRGTTRDAARLEEIDASGLEAAVADPDRPGTILELVGDIAVVVWLLGSARGEPDVIEAIHGPRLDHLLARLVDTPVRGFAYEAAGSVEPNHLATGRGVVERAAETWRIPVAILDEEPGAGEWARSAAGTVESLLGR